MYVCQFRASVELFALERKLDEMKIKKIQIPQFDYIYRNIRLVMYITSTLPINRTPIFKNKNSNTTDILLTFEKFYCGWIFFRTHTNHIFSCWKYHIMCDVRNDFFLETKDRKIYFWIHPFSWKQIRRERNDFFFISIHLLFLLLM